MRKYSILRKGRKQTKVNVSHIYVIFVALVLCPRLFDHSNVDYWYLKGCKRKTEADSDRFVFFSKSFGIVPLSNKHLIMSQPLEIDPDSSSY